MSCAGQLVDIALSDSHADGRGMHHFAAAIIGFRHYDIRYSLSNTRILVTGRRSEPFGNAQLQLKSRLNYPVQRYPRFRTSQAIISLSLFEDAVWVRVQAIPGADALEQVIYEFAVKC